MKIMAFILMLVVSIPMAFAKDADIEFRLRSKLITKLFNQAMSNFTAEDGYIKESISSQTYTMNLKLSDYMDIEDPHYYGEKLLGLNLKGESKVNLLFKHPYVQAKVTMKDPKFTSKNKDGSILDVQFEVVVQNYYLYFKHIWINESGLSNGQAVDANSCTHKIMDGSYADQKLVDEHQDKLKSFYNKLNNSHFKNVKNTVWARVDDLSIGYREYRGAKELDGANVLKLKVIGKVDLRDNKDTLSITSITHNLGKKGGAKLKVHLNSNAIQIPPIFLKTKYAAVDDDGYMVKDENDSQVWNVRCTPVNLDFASTYAASFIDDMTAKVYGLLTDEFTQGMVDKVNSTIKEMNIKNLPTRLNILSSNNDRAEHVALRAFNYVMAKDVDVNIYEDISKMIGDFTTYRAALGLNHITTENGGKSLVMKIDAELVVDNDQLVYRENTKIQQFSNHNKFKFGLHHDDVAFALSGKMIQKTINFVKKRLLKTYVPSAVKVKLNSDMYNVDAQGYIVLTPKVEVKIKGIDLVKIDLKVRAKPSIKKTKSGRVYITLKFDVPNANKILKSIRVGKYVKAAGTIILWTSPLAAVTYYIAKPKIRNILETKINAYIASIKKNYKEFEITDLVEDTGIEPLVLKFHSTGHAAIYIKVNRIKELDQALSKVKAKMELF